MVCRLKVLILIRERPNALIEQDVLISIKQFLLVGHILPSCVSFCIRGELTFCFHRVEIIGCLIDQALNVVFAVRSRRTRDDHAISCHKLSIKSELTHQLEHLLSVSHLLLVAGVLIDT